MSAITYRVAARTQVNVAGQIFSDGQPIDRAIPPNMVSIWLAGGWIIPDDSDEVAGLSQSLEPGEASDLRQGHEISPPTAATPLDETKPEADVPATPRAPRRKRS